MRERGVRVYTTESKEREWGRKREREKKKERHRGKWREIEGDRETKSVLNGSAQKEELRNG